MAVNKIALHLIFWFVITSIALYFKVVIHQFSTELVLATSIDIAFVALFSYINLYLFKVFYEKSKWLSFIFFIILSVAMIALARYYIEIEIFAKMQIEFQSFGSRKIMAKILTTLIFLGLSSGYYLSGNYFKRKNEAFLIKEQHLQLELDFLKSRVNPHFLFNTLGNIHALILQKSDRAADAILELSDLMRYMFYNTQENKVSLKQELEFIESFVELHKIRSSSELDIQIENKILSDIYIEPLLFVSFVENVFKHGDIYQGGSLKLEFKSDGDEINFSCKNSFVAKEGNNKKQSGFGIENVKKRLDLLYPTNSTLKVSKEQGFFIVELNINLKDEESKNI